MMPKQRSAATLTPHHEFAPFLGGLGELVRGRLGARLACPWSRASEHCKVTTIQPQSTETLLLPGVAALCDHFRCSLYTPLTVFSHSRHIRASQTFQPGLDLSIPSRLGNFPSPIGSISPGDAAPVRPVSVCRSAAVRSFVGLMPTHTSHKTIIIDSIYRYRPLHIPPTLWCL
jgi:hypothetical protein